MSTPTTRMLRRSLEHVVLGMTVLAIVGHWWGDHAGGTATRVVIAVAARLCPDGSPRIVRPTIVDGAHVLDRAALRRGLDALGVGQRRCRRGRAA